MWMVLELKSRLGAKRLRNGGPTWLTNAIPNRINLRWSVVQDGGLASWELDTLKLAILDVRWMIRVMVSLASVLGNSFAKPFY